MAYLISIGSTVCGTTAIMATAPIINAKKSESSLCNCKHHIVWNNYQCLVYPYFANIYFNGDPLRM